MRYLIFLLFLSINCFAQQGNYIVITGDHCSQIGGLMCSSECLQSVTYSYTIYENSASNVTDIPDTIDGGFIRLVLSDNRRYCLTNIQSGETICWARVTSSLYNPMVDLLSGDPLNLNPATYHLEVQEDFAPDCCTAARDTFTVRDYTICTRPVHREFEGESLNPLSSPCFSVPVDNLLQNNMIITFRTDVVPDSFTLSYNGSIYFDSGLITGSETWSNDGPGGDPEIPAFTYVPGVDSITVCVGNEGTDAETIWELYIGCCVLEPTTYICPPERHIIFNTDLDTTDCPIYTIIGDVHPLLFDANSVPYGRHQYNPDSYIKSFVFDFTENGSPISETFLNTMQRDQEGNYINYGQDIETINNCNNGGMCSSDNINFPVISQLNYWETNNIGGSCAEDINEVTNMPCTDLTFSSVTQNGNDYEICFPVGTGWDQFLEHWDSLQSWNPHVSGNYYFNPGITDISLFDDVCISDTKNKILNLKISNHPDLGQSVNIGTRCWTLKDTSIMYAPVTQNNTCCFADSFEVDPIRNVTSTILADLQASESWDTYHRYWVYFDSISGSGGRIDTFNYEYIYGIPGQCLDTLYYSMIADFDEKTTFTYDSLDGGGDTIPEPDWTDMLGTTRFHYLKIRGCTPDPACGDLYYDGCSELNFAVDTYDMTAFGGNASQSFIDGADLALWLTGNTIYSWGWSDFYCFPYIVDGSSQMNTTNYNAFNYGTLIKNCP